MATDISQDARDKLDRKQKIGSYDDVATARSGMRAVELLRQYLEQRGLKYSQETLRALAPNAAKVVGRAVPLTGAAMTGWNAGGLAYDHMSRDAQDAVGGTINQIAQRLGGGVDDTAYLQGKAADGGMLRAQMRRAPMAVAKQQPRVPAGDYTGPVNQRFEQALGTPTRYISPNAGNQRLNSMYDDSFGYGMVRR